jgi:hypothetical protein
MFVWIGRYRNHWNTQNLERIWYRWRYDKYDWEVTKKDRDRWDHAFERTMEFCQDYVCRPVNWIKRKIPRINIIKIHKYDTWSMDSTLAPIILPMLKQLNECKHGAPCTEDSDVPEHLRSTAAPSKENEWDTDALHFERWDWIMGEMIWAFEQLNDDDMGNDQFRKGESDIMFQAIDANDNPIGEPHRIGEKSKELDDNDSVLAYRMVDGPRHTMVTDYEGMARHHARINNGLRLFGAYYRSLWD